ncbi:MAG: type I secretion C-terminal target domain-containing protein [Alphaproteobacteria bacterium]|nr:type I secretion C-terminal target domain-containing protein [Alphaproteobacteria bacterium]
MTIHTLSIDLLGAFTTERPVINIYYGNVKIGVAYADEISGTHLFSIDTSSTFNSTMLRVSFVNSGTETGRSATLSNIKIDGNDINESSFSPVKNASVDTASVILTQGGFADYNAAAELPDTILTPPPESSAPETTHTLSMDIQGTFTAERPIVTIYYGGKKIGMAYANATSQTVNFTIDTTGEFNSTMLRVSFTNSGTEVNRAVSMTNIKIDGVDITESDFAALKNATVNSTTITLTQGGFADYNAAAALPDTIINAPDINGTAGNDKLYGTNSGEIIRAGDGNDTVYGLDGNDTIYGGIGSDVLLGDGDNDTIYGEDGNDTIYGGEGNDTLEGGAGNDKLYGDAGNDTLRGGAGVDILNGGDGDDRLYGGDGDDYLYANEGADDRLYGEDGNDRLFGGSGDNFLDGGNGNDIIKGYAGNDTIYGQAGDDVINGDEGDDTIYGGTGIDKLYGADGNDIIYGGDDNDFIYGNLGNDILSGDAGDDYMTGGNDNDILYGGTGNDTILGDDGDDTVDGDEGDDILIGGFGADIMRGDDGNDIMYGGGLDSGDSGPILTANPGVFANASTQSFYQIITTGASWATASATAASTLLNGVAGHLLVIETQAENDYIFSKIQAGGTSIWLDASDVTSEGAWVWNSGFGGQFAQGSSAVNGRYENFTPGQPNGGAAQNYLAMSAGTALDSWSDETGSALYHYVIEWDYESVMSDVSNDIMDGGAGDDLMYGNAGNDTMTGGSGRDILVGGAGMDNINAGDDDDAIYLANGDFVAGEILIGGAGTDTLILTDATTVNLTTGTLATIEILTGSFGSDVVTLLATNLAGMFTAVDLKTGTDTLNVVASGNISAASIATISNVETGNLTGTTSNNSITLSGAQLDAILIGAGIINLDAGTDTINLTTTSADLNTLGATDASILGVEVISFSTAAAGVTLNLGGQTENFIITGSGFNDSITAGLGADNINAGAGNDTIYLATAAFVAGEIINGGTGTDGIVFSNAGTIDFTKGTLTGIETITATTGTDTITLQALSVAGMLTSIDMVSGTDILNVIANGDISGLTLATFNNIDTGNLVGTGNDNTITLTGEQLDAILIGTGSISLGNGTDTINLTSTSLDLNALANTRLVGVEIISASTAGAGVTINLGLQTEAFTITGSAHDDIITGGSIADIIDAGAGNDIIYLFSGAFDPGESIDGGTGTDTIIFTNATSVNFSQGTLVNVEYLTGTIGNDTITMTASQWAGFTSIDMGGGTDRLYVVADGADISALGAPIYANVSGGYMTGTAGDDSITITGEQLDALLFGTGTISLGTGTDTINLTSTSIELNALASASLSGVEIISAATAAAGVILNVSLQTESYTLIGSAYDDVITGGTVADTINAGNGNDIIYLFNGAVDAGESIDGGAGTDEIIFTNATTANFSLGSLVNVEIMTGSALNDTVTLNAAQWADLTTIDLAGGSNRIYVVADGSDISALTLPTISNLTHGYLSGTTGDDSVTLSGEQLDAILFGLGTISLGTGTNDTINLTSTSVDLNALSNSYLVGVEFISAHSASAGVTIDLNVQTEAFTLTGGDYNDVIVGSRAADTIHGGSGDDIINGHRGDDILYGDEGADIFAFSATPGIDTIADFNVGEMDKLDISNLLTNFVGGVSDIDDYLTFTVSGSDTLVSVDTNGLTGGSVYVQIATLTGVTGVSVQDLYDAGQILA